MNLIKRLYADHNLLISYCLSVLFLVFQYNSRPCPPTPFTPQKRTYKMTPVSPFLPTLPLPPYKCTIVNCNAICEMMVGAQYRTKLKRVLDKNPRLRGGDKCLGHLGSRKIVKLLVNGGYER